MNKQAVDLSTVSAADLKAALKKKTAAERATQEEKVANYKTLRDDYLGTVFGKMAELSPLLLAFKTESLTLGLEIHALMYEVYGREKRDLDSYTITDDDGLRKVVMERHHICQYDETAEVAVGLIKEVLEATVRKRDKGMYKMLSALLVKNLAGDFDEKMVAKLRTCQEEVGDERFNQALDMLSAAYKPVGSRMYIRAYKRATKEGKWEEVTMNWSSM